MYSLRNKKNIIWIRPLICSYAYTCIWTQPRAWFRCAVLLNVLKWIPVPIWQEQGSRAKTFASNLPLDLPIGHIPVLKKLWQNYTESLFALRTSASPADNNIRNPQETHVLNRNVRKRTFTSWHMRPTKTQISLRIRAVWSESSLSAWRNFASLAI